MNGVDLGGKGKIFVAFRSEGLHPAVGGQNLLEVHVKAEKAYIMNK